MSMCKVLISSRALLRIPEQNVAARILGLRTDTEQNMLHDAVGAVLCLVCFIILYKDVPT